MSEKCKTCKKPIRIIKNHKGLGIVVEPILTTFTMNIGVRIIIPESGNIKMAEVNDKGYVLHRDQRGKAK